jgi:hypothetical protein
VLLCGAADYAELSSAVRRGRRDSLRRACRRAGRGQREAERLLGEGPAGRGRDRVGHPEALSSFLAAKKLASTQL